MSESETKPALDAEVEDELWRDAWRIAWVGAASPAACANLLSKHLAAVTHVYGTRDAGRHLALQAIASHMASLMHMTGYELGPSDESLSAVQTNAIHLGLMDESVHVEKP